MKKIFFLIHDLGQGGAEKVLVNLVNNMDRSKFDISVTVLFGGGVNEQFLAPDIHFHTVFPKEVPGNSKLMKLLTPAQLHRMCVKEHYDIRILLDGAGFSQVGKLRPVIHSLFHRSGELRQHDDRALHLPGKLFEHPGQSADFLLPSFCFPLDTHELQIVDDDEIQSLFSFQAPAFILHLQNGDARRVVDINLRL